MNVLGSRAISPLKREVAGQGGAGPEYGTAEQAPRGHLEILSTVPPATHHPPVLQMGGHNIDIILKRTKQQRTGQTQTPLNFNTKASKI